MKEIFVTYLESIGMQGPRIRFVSENYEFIESQFVPLLKEEIADIFIEDTVSEDNKRMYENIYFITKSFFIEVKMSSGIGELNISPIQEVRFLNVRRKDYNFENATPESRMNIKFSFSDRGMAVLSASGTNCDKLKEIMHKYIIPKMIL
jgi:hypothetical protein